MGEPPEDADGVQDTVAEPSPARAALIVGAEGRPSGVTAADRAENGLVPRSFLAATSNV
jgi:hypothetical protein